jgi:hypothetical protein
MKRPRLDSLALAPFVLVALLGTANAARLVAQDEHKGKIDDVEHSADNAKRDGDDRSDGGGGAFFWMRGVVHAFFYTPRDTGQGYLAYPYAGPYGASFVVRDVDRGRSFGAVSATYFRDDGSSLRGGHFAIEWTGGALDRTVEYSYFRERKADETDQLSMLHIGLAALPRVGELGYLKVGVAFQGVFTDQGDVAAGPELVLGTQLLPARPFGLTATARLAMLTWAGGPAFGTGFVDLMGGGSVFLGRAELQAGYRWTRVGIGAAFGGPTLGLRAWF